MATGIHESGEMYLEHILNLEQELGQVRSVDISQRTGYSKYMGYSKPSVSRAVGLLRKNRLIDIDGAGYITLTDAGRRIATRIYERHECLTAIFVSLGVPRDIAVQDACKIEHDISEETFHALRSHFGK